MIENNASLLTAISELENKFVWRILDWVPHKHTDYLAYRSLAAQPVLRGDDKADFDGLTKPEQVSLKKSLFSKSQTNLYSYA